MLVGRVPHIKRHVRLGRLLGSELREHAFWRIREQRGDPPGRGWLQCEQRMCEPIAASLDFPVSDAAVVKRDRYAVSILLRSPREASAGDESAARHAVLTATV